MVVTGVVKKGAYFDSVTLMGVARELSAMEGVEDAAVVMGTEENRAILEGSGLVVREFADAAATDLLVAVRAVSEEAARDALAAAERLLADVRKKAGPSAAFEPSSVEGALEVLPEANIALISVAGRYAGGLAREALERGLDVMLFSDNVPLETEVTLKSYARERGLLVMGPDCGTAIIGGAPLGFANVVNRGPVGIVAASGTGLQEVSCLVSEKGSGVSHAIGTGGRDVKDAVGGVTFLAAMDMLADDPATDVVVLVSKPPDPGVLRAIREKARAVGKPIVSVFLGSAPADPTESATLWGAAVKALALVEGRDPATVGELSWPEDSEPVLRAREASAALGAGRRLLRGLMSGGTFAAEALVVLAGAGVGGLHSNAPTAGAAPLDDASVSIGNAVIDLGADEFTVGRPHPMIDYSVRKERIAREADDPDTAVILLDVVLGYGAHPAPAGELIDVIDYASRRVAVVCSVTGTDRDPQNSSAVESALAEAGAHVMPSNAEAALFAAHVVRSVEGA